MVLDANVIIAHFNAEDTHHTNATALLTSLAGADLLMHSLTIAEVLIVPTRLRQADRALFRMHQLGVSEWVPDTGQARYLAELRVETGLKMPDVCVLDTALSNDADLATFDTPLATAARALGITVLDATTLGASAPSV